MIHFNRPFMTGRETEYIRQAVADGKISGNGEFTHRCQEYFEKRYGFRKCLLTTSCSDALEMAAILTDVGPGDEVIVPSYTFVSTALAFVRQGATVVFADSCGDHPNVDAEKIESLVTPRTKVIAVVHYAGCACDMDAVMAIAERHGLLVVEDAAQAIDSFYLGVENRCRCTNEDQHSAVDLHLKPTPKPLGSVGHLACFSFHETKNIISGEGGLLAVNDARFVRRAEIIWEKGTNRAEFFRGEVNKYGWVDTGSSFLPTEIVSAFLWAQLEHLDEIQAVRKGIWEKYYGFFAGLDGVRPETGDPADRGAIRLPKIPEWATNNAHMFYLLFPDLATRSDFIAKMRAQDILCVFHYLPLHTSDFYRRYVRTHRPSEGAEIPDLPNCDRYADTLVRLPLYAGLGADQDRVLAAARAALGR